MLAGVQETRVYTLSSKVACGGDRASVTSTPRLLCIPRFLKLTVPAAQQEGAAASPPGHRRQTGKTWKAGSPGQGRAGCRGVAPGYSRHLGVGVINEYFRCFSTHRIQRWPVKCVTFSNMSLYTDYSNCTLRLKSPKFPRLSRKKQGFFK